MASKVASASMAMPIKKSVKIHQSKNRKKGWRKHSKIEEIEEHLEDVRLDERLGGAAAHKTNDKLFFIDIDVKKTEVKSGKLKGKKRLEVPLKCFENLKSSSLVAPPIKPYQLQTKKRLKRLNSKQTKRLAISNADYEKKQSVKKIIPGTAAAAFDLWDEKRYEKDELTILGTKILDNQFANVPAHRFQKPSLLPSVEPPHPGASYNPGFADHQALLAAANAIEESKLRAQQHLDRVLTLKFPTAQTAPTQESWIKEMSGGLFESDNEDDEEEEDEINSENEGVTKFWGKPIDRETRKLHAKRNAEKSQKLKILENAKEKIAKKRNHNVNYIKQYQKELKSNEEIYAKRLEKRDKQRQEAMYKPRRIGSEKYVAPDMELHLTEELAGSLRNLKSEGNIMDDRYKSLQRRNVIEPRSRKKFVRKYKLKEQVKRSHREAQKEIDDTLKVKKNKRKRNKV